MYFRNMDLQQQKLHLRHSIRERMERFPGQKRDAESRSVVRRILEHLPAAPITICGYAPMGSEVNISPLFPLLLERGDALFLPHTEGKAFTFRRVTDLSALRPGPFKVLEPPEDGEELVPADVGVALVPGVAFDHSGMRLGRGNGGYDRWIAELRAENDAAETWGIAFECQVVQEVPSDPHDMQVDALVTARGLVLPSS